MKKPREKMKLEPGVKYRGWGMVNEYGEVTFEASQPTTNPNGMKIVREDEDFTLYESSNYWKASVRLSKSGGLTREQMLKQFASKLWAAVWTLGKYVNEPNYNRTNKKKGTKK